MATSPAGANSALHCIEWLGDACLVLDDAEVIVGANRAALDLHLPSTGDMVGDSIHDWCEYSLRDELLAELASTNGTARHFRTVLLRGDLTTFEADVTCSSCELDGRKCATLLIRETRPKRCRDELSLRDLALESVLDGIVIHTLEGDLVYANRSALEQWRAPSLEEVRSRGPFGWVPESSREAIRERIARIIERGEARFVSTSPSGPRSDIEVQARLLDSPMGPVIVSTARDITDSVETQEMVRYLAYHDSLTGLANRVALEQHLVHELDECDQHSQHVGVVFVDLNDFKPVNDTFGHMVGDHMLREVSNRLVGAVRESDLVARLGGDEFVVVLSRLSGPDALISIAKKLADKIMEPAFIGGHEITVTADVGLAMHRAGEDAESLLTRADLEMYASRERGVAGWELFSDV